MVNQDKTLIYSPKVEAYVMTKGDRIIDLSKDIISGSVRRVTNGVSTASLTLNNKDRRYTGAFDRMDRIYIKATKGSHDYGLFMGYVTTVPVFDAYPTTAVIEAQCTLKQIMHTYWDATSTEAVNKFIVEQVPLKKTQVRFNPNQVTPNTPGQVRLVGTADQQRLVKFATDRKLRYRYDNNSAGKYDPDKSGYSDCSAFLRYCYKSVLGIDIGSYSVEQASTGVHVISGTTKAELDESKLQPGDVIVYDWAAWGRPTYDHVEMYIGNGLRIGHGSGQGPKITPLHGPDLPMAKFTVRRHIEVAYGSPTIGTVGNAIVDAFAEEDSPVSGGIITEPTLGQALGDTTWDSREEYFTQQVADGMSGIRLKGFLNEVCGWDYERILIEPLPQKLADMVTSLEIKEGARDPEDMIQQVYRTIMGDTFANNPAQSQTVLDPNGFTGSEGQGDIVYTQTMFGLAKVLSQLNYNHDESMGNSGGSGAYSLTKHHFGGKEAKTQPKTAQDAKMLSLLKKYVNSGTDKTVKELAKKFLVSELKPNIDIAGTEGLHILDIDEIVSKVEKNAKNAPVPRLMPGTQLTTQTPLLANGNDQVTLYLKGLKETESNGNYQAQNPGSSASGAYQYITRTWNYYGGYPTAASAPPEVQDKRAREDALAAYARFNDWEMVAANHIFPLWAKDKSKWNQVPAPGNPTVREYVNKVLRYMDPNAELGAADNPLVGGSASQDDIFDQLQYAFFKQVNFNNDQVSSTSDSLSGERALMNDQSALEFVKILAKGSMREFQSDREGNFMAFYPDHFGMYKDNPKDSLVPIQEVEIKNFTIRATDTIFTHVYTIDHSEYPDLLWRGQSSISELQMQLDTNGIVTFENEKMMKTILGWDSNKVKDFLQRFGGRPSVTKALEITNKTFSKVFTIATFLERWAGQYNTSVDFTFMPELWPGNRASIGNTNVAVYVDSVTHNFSYTGGFTTSATISCPQSIGENEFDLPKGAF